MISRTALTALAFTLALSLGAGTAIASTQQPAKDSSSAHAADKREGTPSPVFSTAGKQDSTDVTGQAPASTDSRKPATKCRNTLVRTLRSAGFRGENLREAWSIAMRESGGRASAVSPTRDYGLFQFNRATFAKQDWWDSSRLLTAEYSAQLAYRYSQGGRTWYLWGLDGKGRANPKLYVQAGWSKEKVNSHIMAPYRKWYAKYPC